MIRSRLVCIEADIEAIRRERFVRNPTLSIFGGIVLTFYLITL
jgi:hypothetical protein